MKFIFNDTVMYNNEVGIIQDSRITNDVLQYLVYLEDGTKIWTKEDVLMPYTTMDIGKVGDIVTYYDNGFKHGTVVDVDYHNGFKYLVEAINRERYWKDGSEVNVCKSR